MVCNKYGGRPRERCRVVCSNQIPNVGGNRQKRETRVISSEPREGGRTEMVCNKYGGRPRESCRLVCSNQLTNVRRNRQERKPRFISSDPWPHSAIEFRKLLVLGCRAFDFVLSLLWSNCTCHGAVCSPCRVYVQFCG